MSSKLSLLVVLLALVVSLIVACPPDQPGTGGCVGCDDAGTDLDILDVQVIYNALINNGGLRDPYTVPAMTRKNLRTYGTARVTIRNRTNADINITAANFKVAVDAIIKKCWVDKSINKAPGGGWAYSKNAAGETQLEIDIMNPADA